MKKHKYLGMCADYKWCILESLADFNTIKDNIYEYLG